MKGCYLHNSESPRVLFASKKRNGERKQERCDLSLHLDHLLSLPNSLDALGETNIVCLELVETNTGEDGGGVESPHGELAGLGDALAGEVVDDA